jgi:very-short-patch-repair endonuclease
LDESIDQRIGALAKRQRGWVRRDQLLRLGASRSWIQRRVERNLLVPYHHGLYAVGHLPLMPIDYAAGAVLACGPCAALSHLSAARLWDWRKHWVKPHQVMAPTNHAHPGVEFHRCRRLTQRDIRTHYGIRVTSPARTVLDCAPILGSAEFRRLLSEAQVSKHLRRSGLAEVLARFPRHPGASLVVAMLDAAGPTRSEFEEVFRAFCQRFGLPAPRFNEPVARYELDAYFPEHRLSVELDGWHFHRTRAAFEHDRNKDADLLLLGIATVRITWERLRQRPEAEASRLEAILAGRRRAG